MDTVGKLIAAALLCSVICLLLKKQAPELTLCLCVLVCALCFLTSFPFFSPILAFFHRLQELTGLSGAVFAPLFKTAAIGLLRRWPQRSAGTAASRRLRRPSRSAAALSAFILRCRFWKWCFLCCKR